MSDPNELDFLEDVTPAAPEPAPAPESELELEPPTMAQRLALASQARDAAKAVYDVASKLLNDLIRESEVPEEEVPLHVRNADARRIDAELAQDHRAAMAKLEAMGIDVARVIREGARPRARKAPPQFFKP